MSTKDACKSDTDDVAGASILVFQTVQYSFADYCRELGRDYERRGDVRGGGAIKHPDGPPQLCTRHRKS